MRRIMIGLAPALIAMSASAAAAAPAWKVSEISGEVRLTENGRSRAAVKGALLASGATITTGATARAVIVRGEEFVVISPRSQLRLPAAEASNKIMQIIEDFGTAVFRINKKSSPHFGVQTPYLAAVVKGTTFTVTVGPEGGSVQVTEGAVEVATLDGGAVDLITPGNIAMVGASDLYQLTIEGEGSKVLRSGEAPAAGAATSAVAPSPYVGPPAPAVRIEAPLAENSLSLSSVTDGLLDGSAAMEFAAVEFADQTRASIVGFPADPAPIETPGPGEVPPGDGDDDDEQGRPGRNDQDGRDRPDQVDRPDRPDRPEMPDKPGKDDDLPNDDDDDDRDDEDDDRGDDDRDDEDDDEDDDRDDEDDDDGGDDDGDDDD